MNADILKRLIQLEKAASPGPWEMDTLDSRDAELVHYAMYNSDKAEGKVIFCSAWSEDRLITDESDEDGPHYRDDVAFNNFLFIKGMRNHAKELLEFVRLATAQIETQRDLLADIAKDRAKLRKIAAHVPGDIYIKAKEDAGFAEAVRVTGGQ